MARVWHTLGTGAAFAAFAAGTLLLAFLVLPLLRLFHRPDPDLHIAVQRIVHLAFRALLKAIESLGLVRIVWTGAERLRAPGPLLVVANHPSLIDVLLLVACMPQVDCVVKQAHWRRRIMRRVVTAAGYVSNADGDALVEACVGRLRQGRSVLLFPEGTRSPAGTLGLFHRGLAHVSLRSGCDPVPVVIRVSRPLLSRGTRWHHISGGAVEISVEVHAPFAVARSDDLRVEPKAVRALTVALRDLYVDHLWPGSADYART